MTIPDIRVTRTQAPKQRPDDAELSFGKVMTDHMFLMDYEEGKGWHDPRIVPYGPLSMDPATSVLHYGQTVFDGLKAFRGQDGTVRLFRAQRHAERLNRSCAALCIPPMDPELIRRSFEELVAVDHDWVPRRAGTSLYIRPTVVATEVQLGVHPAHRLTYFVICSPVGAYYKEGVKPVRILATDKYVRAVRGGLGEAKTAANYAASLAAAQDAEAQGYTQVLWLDGVERRYLDEVGTMNIMVKIGDEVITPPLAGTILDGVTRNSILTLLHDWGVKASERPVTIDEVMQAGRDGTLREMWGTGTAAVVSPVGMLGYKGEKVVINGGETGPLTQKLYEAIVAIQYGTAPDAHGWTSEVKVPAEAS
ncbi:Branched-chain amino acid aminotransferase [Roseomonas mucosa]|jgi:branched-chain amino acid aminotransferase|uniref:Probable branched-chain-amino-acid aminotransferase n=1 Tax=Roseomonas mucosa TaxID=207340 RepID=A0A4Y1N1Y5_9PROT|nr:MULTISPECIES: branched-chain amino acid aminotransferase [Roseomonas]MDT8265126.1 branched-chain amino acid aminotransferase [Roseomonas sp. DSM 102946]ATR22726.1 branched-chain amino acid aminotransferase [Roseomonas sp. FDAARGOS_362]AWV24252.1 Branched-chain amino acid aminotransferase [Roseomonas mucosa]MDT8355727.1 branched-chain amino acid aminotransferase [Roseomonas mucosa]USQ72569.1 branched-chain amino acid aminotransferase [Roseomonas mucosa]